MANRPSRSELVKQRAENIFTGREQQLEAFRTNLKLPLDDSDRKLIWMICGEGGVGKTTLLRRFRQLLEQDRAICALVDETTATTVLNAMGAFAEEFDRQGYALKAFAERYRTYRQLQKELESDPDYPTGISAAIGRGGARLGMELLKQTPIAGAIVQAMGEETIIEKAGELAHFVRRKVGNKDEVRLVLEPVRELTPLFIQDLSDLAAKRPVALCIDTYERSASALDSWLRELLCGRYGELDINVYTLIAGRERLERVNQDWSDERIQPFLETIALEAFSEDEARAYLAKQNITNPDVIDVLLQLSGRIPVLLATLASKAPDDPEAIGDPSDDAINRFLRWVVDDNERSDILVCALPRQFDLDVVAAVVGSERAARVFTMLQRMTFVHRSAAGVWVYHDLVRRMMLRYRRQESPQRWREDNERLAAHFAAARDALQLTLADGLDEPRWQHLNLEWLYHQLCAQKNTDMQIAVEAILQTFNPGSPSEYDHDLGVTISEAGSLINDIALKNFGDGVTIGMDAYNQGNWRDAVAMFDMLRQHLERVPSETLAAFYNAKGRLHLKLGDLAEADANLSSAIKLRPENSNNFHWRGAVQFESKNYTGAASDFSRVIELQPDDGYNFYLLGRTRFNLKEYVEAESDFSRAIVLEPNNGYNFHWRGSTRYELKDYAGAESDLNRAIELKPDDGENFYWRGRTKYELQDYAGAESDFDHAIELQPDDGDSFYWRGRTKYELQDYAGAESDFDHAVELQPDDGGNYNWRGSVRFELKDYIGADRDLSRAIELQPDDVYNFYWRGRAKYELQEYVGAASDFTRAIELQPDEGENYRWRGQVHYELQDYSGAENDFSRAIELEPNNGCNFHWRGSTRYVLQNYTGAASDLSRAIELQPDEGYNFYGRGRIKYELKDFAGAESDFSHAIELQPDNGYNFYWRGLTRYEVQDYAGAESDFSHTIKLLPEDGYNFQWRGRVRYLLEDYANAAGDFRLATHLQPDNVTNFLMCGLLGHRLKDYAKAESDFSYAIELEPDNAYNFHWRGRTRHILKNYVGSMNDFSRAIELQPDNGLNVYWRGRAKYELKDYARAESDFSHAIELQPNNGHNFRWRGLTRYELKDYDGAESDLSRAVELQPNHDSNFYWRGIVRLALGQTSSAQADHERTMELIAQDADQCNQARLSGRVAALKNDEAEARWEYTSALTDCESNQDWQFEIDHLRDIAQYAPQPEKVQALADWLEKEVEQRKGSG